MALLTALFWLSIAFLGAQLVVLLTNLVAFPVLAGAAAGGGRVSILVPARNEAEVLPETLPRLLSQPALEVVVLDDQSTDATPNLLERMRTPGGGLRVLAGKPLPDGWTGKNWACQQLAEAAAGDWLLFTDADVLWEPGALDAILGLRSRFGADFASVWPRQDTVGLLERVAVPQLDLILLGSLPHLGVQHLPFSSLAAGNGQMMLWSRRGYRAVGGHAAVRGEVLEDVRMGQRAKGAGLRLALGLGGRLLHTRMYRSPGALAEGFRKNIAAGAGHPLALLLLLLLALLAYSLSWVLALLEPRWLIVGLLGLLLRGLSDAKAGRNPLQAPLQVLAPLVAWWIGLGPLLGRGGYTWKGRRYP